MHFHELDIIGQRATHGFLSHGAAIPHLENCLKQHRFLKYLWNMISPLRILVLYQGQTGTWLVWLILYCRILYCRIFHLQADMLEKSYFISSTYFKNNTITVYIKIMWFEVYKMQRIIWLLANTSSPLIFQANSCIHENYETQFDFYKAKVIKVLWKQTKKISALHCVCVWGGGVQAEFQTKKTRALFIQNTN